MLGYWSSLNIIPIIRSFGSLIGAVVLCLVLFARVNFGLVLMLQTMLTGVCFTGFFPY